jgi:heme/copper-type cytochrome/quinol oxidase subunit 2
MSERGSGHSRRTLLVVAAAFGIAIAGCGAAAAEGDAAKPAVAPAAKGAMQTRKIKLEVEKWTWSPDTIKVKRGTHVVLDVYSRDASRALELKAFGVKAALPQGETVRVEFDADRAGTFPWRCARPCGDGCARLKGSLIVEE